MPTLRIHRYGQANQAEYPGASIGSSGCLQAEQEGLLRRARHIAGSILLLTEGAVRGAGSSAQSTRKHHKSPQSQPLSPKAM